MPPSNITSYSLVSAIKTGDAKACEVEATKSTLVIKDPNMAYNNRSSKSMQLILTNFSCVEYKVMPWTY